MSTTSTGFTIQSLDIELDGHRFSRFAAMDAGKYVGCIDLAEIAPGRCSFRQLFVVPYFRRLGVASTLLSHIKQIARFYGAKSLECECRKDNIEALQFYSRHGFKVIGQDGENLELGIEL